MLLYANSVFNVALCDFLQGSKHLENHPYIIRPAVIGCLQSRVPVTNSRVEDRERRIFSFRDLQEMNDKLNLSL